MTKLGLRTRVPKFLYLKPAWAIAAAVAAGDSSGFPRTALNKPSALAPLAKLSGVASLVAAASSPIWSVAKCAWAGRAGGAAPMWAIGTRIRQTHPDAVEWNRQR